MAGSKSLTDQQRQMEAMIAATLTFVRDAQADPQRTRLELSSLLESVVDDMADTGADVAVEKAEKVVIDAKLYPLVEGLDNHPALRDGKAWRVDARGLYRGETIIDAVEHCAWENDRKSRARK